MRAHSKSERSVGYVFLMHDRVPNYHYPILTFRTVSLGRSLIKQNTQYNAGQAECDEKGQAMGRRHRRRHRSSRGAFQLGRAATAALIIIVLVLGILRLLGVY